ncbi:6-phosphogluconolactonase [Corynebacterium frankenforstense]|uniref:6-phosphogluconolactonase n=1 Tax=Corynebacterium frankenforstense TaxID=1230998 RepID=UPI0026ED9D0B|nr:6-phosphogluconolactonase [Corynebacterium frankenforstense]
MTDAPVHPARPEIVRVADLEELTRTAAARFIEVVAAVQAPGGGRHGDGVARVVLTGGGAGTGMLAKLAEFDAAADAQTETFPALRVDWSRVEVFFGDERDVPVTDPESNEGQARAALLEAVGVPEANIHGWRLGAGRAGDNGLELETAVERYATVLEEFAPRGFDLHLLGMGGEGHVNSVFPHTPGTRADAPEVLAVTDSPKPPARRGTITLNGVARAERVWLLVAGAGKAEAAAHVASGSSPADWPAAGARGAAETLLFLDDAAAGEPG